MYHLNSPQQVSKNNAATDTNYNKSLSNYSTLLCLMAMTVALPSLASEEAQMEMLAQADVNDRSTLISAQSWEDSYSSFNNKKSDLYDEHGFAFAGFHSSLFQVASDTKPDFDNTGLATIAALYGTWNAVKHDDPSAGQIGFGVEARWGYGNLLTPVELGQQAIGSATGSADPYDATNPTFVLRDLYWRGGSEDQGWSYRLGKMTVDRMLGSSKYANATSTFLPVGSQGAPSIAYPDSALGAAVAFYPSERFRFGAVIADAYGDRTNFGDITEGDFFKAVELQAKLFPLNEEAGFSTLSFWHTDGVDDPEKANGGSTGEEGWGLFVKHEQQLTKDGNNIAVFRYGRAFDDAAVYKEQGSVRYIKTNVALKDDMFGVAASYVKPVYNPMERDEWSIDTFYRINLFKNVETSVGYQMIFNPAYNASVDRTSVYSFRITQTF
ncbi:carbohydrate porin [Vibrio sp. D404a]|uniref:carbohydrate porin n=1 Tax=unclassified Vibrio TaxID=2614977 RepID=UPI0025568C97|nr:MULTISPECIES: carbohydrate porin [unclassified Vibrio]MDK9735677.1 carbohydrate porin [Vibrio sp. D404a]MDK9798593.1 carbohydrate porin [Vibrio sp. D449a]